jgi:hypothetical protein
MQHEAAIVMLSYVIIASIFLVFGLVFFIVYKFKSALGEFEKFVKLVTIIYEADHENPRTDVEEDGTET